MKNPSDAKKVIEAAFGPVENFTGAQLWALTKLCKNVRLRCRNNSAFNNYFNGIFAGVAKFSTVNKTRPNRYTGAPESYPGLQITDKAGNALASNAGAEDEGEE